MRIEKLSFDRVNPDGIISPREELDLDAIEDYSRHIADLPPMRVYQVPGTEDYILTRGFHRIEAHRLAGLTEAQFEVLSGSIADAQEDADLDNFHHGVRLNRIEMRRIIGRHLKRYPKNSDTWIAEDCHTTDKTVRSVREELEATGSIEKSDRLIGRDGITRPRNIIQPKKVRRKKSKLEDRMTPCKNCQHPLSVTVHYLDVAAHGENPYSTRLCQNCHEIFDIIIKVYEMGEDRLDTRTVQIYRYLLDKIGPDDPRLKRLNVMAEAISKARSLTKGRIPERN